MFAKRWILLYKSFFLKVRTDQIYLRHSILVIIFVYSTLFLLRLFLKCLLNNFGIVWYCMVPMDVWCLGLSPNVLPTVCLYSLECKIYFIVTFTFLTDIALKTYLKIFLVFIDLWHFSVTLSFVMWLHRLCGGRQSVCKQSQTDCIHSQTNLQRFAINCHLIIKQIANTLQSELIWNLLIDIFCCIAKYLPKGLLIRFCGFLLEGSSHARFMQYCCEYTQVTFFSNFLADVWIWFSYMGWSHFAGWDVEPYRRPLWLTVSLAINRPQLIKPLSDFCLCRKISTIKRP